jgi:hypothetical protein
MTAIKPQIDLKEKEVAIVTKEVSPLVAKAEALKIANANDMAESVELLSRCNKQLDTIIEKEETITAPAKLIIKTEQARWKVAKDTLKTAIDFLRGEQSRYMTLESKRIREEEAKIAARVKDGRGNLSVETAVKKISEIEKPEQKVVTSAGAVKFREIPKLKITDASKVPATYLIIDEVKLFADLKAGAKVEGAEIEMISIAVNTR